MPGQPENPFRAIIRAPHTPRAQDSRSPRQSALPCEVWKLEGHLPILPYVMFTFAGRGTGEYPRGSKRVDHSPVLA